MATTAFGTLNTEGIDFNQTYTPYDQASASSSTNTPDYPGLPAQLGAEALGVNNTSFTFVKAASALAIGDVCQISTTNQATPITTTIATFGSLVGVSNLVVASGAYCWLQRLGPIAKIACAGAAVVNVQMATSTTAGAIDDATTTGTKNLTGIVITATAGGATTVAGVLNYPIVAATN